MEKSTISMAIFNSYVKLQEGTIPLFTHSLSLFSHNIPGSFYMAGYEPLSGHPHYIPIMFPLHPHHIPLIISPYIPIYSHHIPTRLCTHDGY